MTKDFSMFKSSYTVTILYFVFINIIIKITIFKLISNPFQKRQIEDVLSEVFD